MCVVFVCECRGVFAANGIVEIVGRNHLIPRVSSFRRMVTSHPAGAHKTTQHTQAPSTQHRDKTTTTGGPTQIMGGTRKTLLSPFVAAVVKIERKNCHQPGRPGKTTGLKWRSWGGRKILLRNFSVAHALTESTFDTMGESSRRVRVCVRER